VPLFKPVSSTPLIKVDTTEGCEQLLQDFLSQTVIGVDLEVIISLLFLSMTH
jgi:exosome complex exonuclease RRP6